jgi:hypothetical protein
LPGVPLATIEEPSSVSQVQEEDVSLPPPEAEQVLPDSDFLLPEDVKSKFEPGIQF